MSDEENNAKREKMVYKCLQYETSDISCGCKWWHNNCMNSERLCKHQIFYIFGKLTENNKK